MRGVAFVGGAFPTPEAGGEAAQPRPDLVVAADSGLVAALAWGMAPDWVVGDMDSLQDLSLLDRYPPERVLRSPVDKDDTDTELALAVLAREGCDRVDIIGGGGGRLDHLLGIAALFDRPRPPRRWLTDAEEVLFLDGTIELSSVPGGRVSLFPVGAGPWSATSEGLHWPLDPVSWSPGHYGISNRADGSSFSVTPRSGRFILIRPLLELPVH